MLLVMSCDTALHDDLFTDFVILIFAYNTNSKSHFLDYQL